MVMVGENLIFLWQSPVESQAWNAFYKRSLVAVLPCINEKHHSHFPSLFWGLSVSLGFFSLPI